jgi:glyoxylate reductase
MKPKVYVTRKIEASAIDSLREVCDTVVHGGEQAPAYEELKRNVQGKDGLLCLVGDRIDKELFDAAPMLKVVSTMSVGYEHIDVPEATKRGIYVGYTPGVLTEATADLAFALLLCTARRLGEAERFVRAGNWRNWTPSLMVGQSVSGKVIGIVGLGRIGRAMAQRALGFGMKVLYADSERLSPEEEIRLQITYRTLEDLLWESNFVTIHVPLTDKTHHLINEEKLRRMKSDAILINTSRGPTVDEQALARALRDGWIGAAGLDVYETEPLDPASPLLRLENVILLPHIGSATTETRRRMAEIAVHNLLAVLKGKEPPSLLNPQAGAVRPLSETRMI